MSEKVNLSNLNEQERHLYALEALLKRTSLVPMPFVLKGSLLTRQYLANPDIRDAQDIDFLYAGKIDDPEDAHDIFTDWMAKVTKMILEDGVIFDDFDNNDYWDTVSYGMSDDFPTTNTEIYYQLKDESGNLSGYHSLSLDVSFNLVMGIQPVPLDYKSEYFGSFHLDYTVPLPIQIAWKLHQSIVRPRFKDLYDLKFLLSHPSYDKNAISETLQELVNECSFDRSVTKDDIKKVLVGDLYDLFPFVHEDDELIKYAGEGSRNMYFIQFATELRKIMDAAGINQIAFDNLPKTNL
jgi:hypothetical protein